MVEHRSKTTSSVATPGHAGRIVRGAGWTACLSILGAIAPAQALPSDSPLVTSGCECAEQLANQADMARQRLIRIGIRNFRRMADAGRVEIDASGNRLRGLQAATSSESTAGGVNRSSAAVGVGDERISLGPGFADPRFSTDPAGPVVLAQKFVHEGWRTKITIATTAAAMQGSPPQPGPAAPPAERCAWLENQIMVMLISEAVLEVARSAYVAAGDIARAAAAAEELALRQARREKYQEALDGC